MIKIISFLASTTAFATHRSYFYYLLISRNTFVTSFIPPSSNKSHKSNRIAPSSTSSNMSSASPLSILLKEISGKNLLSIEKCIEISNLQQEQDEKEAIFIDSSWCPTWKVKGRNGKLEFKNGGNIIGASFFDFDDIATKGEFNPKGLPHMIPSKELFAAAMDASGISNSNHIVIYGRHGSKTGPRAWHTFRCMGHDKNKVHLMQGTLEEWKKLGGKVEEGSAKVISSSDLDTTKTFMYQAKDAKNIMDMNQILSIINNIMTMIL